jgi:hypothetical protein
VKPLPVIVAILTVAGCHAAAHGTVPSTLTLTQPQPQPPPVHLAACVGPASSIPDSLFRQLPPRNGRMIGDDYWAHLAATVPGGFAGIFYDRSIHRQVLMLTQPALTAAARAALAGKIGLGLTPTVRQARWDFAQLVDWFNYIRPRLGAVPVIADKDEALNRIRLSVTSVKDRDLVIAALARLPLPCDLVIVDLNGFTVQLVRARSGEP